MAVSQECQRRSCIADATHNATAVGGFFSYVLSSEEEDPKFCQRHAKEEVAFMNGEYGVDNPFQYKLSFTS